MEEAVVEKKKRGFLFNFRASLCIPYGVFMLLFVVFPLLLIIYYAFTDGENNFTFENWGAVFSNPDTWRIMGFTFAVAAATTVICILIAYPIAYLLANKKYNKNAILVYIFLLPMWINFVIRTIGLKELINSVTDTLFDWNLTSEHPYIAIVLGMVYDYLPFAILPLYNQMLKLDKNQIEAAADLGANPVQVFTKAIIPQTIPGIVSACMMTFMPTMSSYVIANKMSENKSKIIGNIIEGHFNSTLTNSNNGGSVLSLVMLAIIGVSLLIEKNATNKPVERKGNLW